MKASILVAGDDRDLGSVPRARPRPQGGDAAGAMRSGAFDYISKPSAEAELLRVVGNAVRTSAVTAKEGVGGGEENGWFGMVGRGPAWRETRKVIEKAAASPLSVMVTGETGAGKELVARAIHRISGRGEGPFIKINGAAIPPPLWEAEVFGYEKGAFTGAVLSKPGRFELADGGALFLDEIGGVPPPAGAAGGHPFAGGLFSLSRLHGDGSRREETLGGDDGDPGAAFLAGERPRTGERHREGGGSLGGRGDHPARPLHRPGGRRGGGRDARGGEVPRVGPGPQAGGHPPGAPQARGGQDEGGGGARSSADLPFAAES